MGSCCSSDAAEKHDPYAIPKPEFQPAAQAPQPQPKNSTQTARSFSAEPPVAVEPIPPVIPSPDVQIYVPLNQPAVIHHNGFSEPEPVQHSRPPAPAPFHHTQPPAPAPAPAPDDAPVVAAPLVTPAVTVTATPSPNEPSGNPPGNHKKKPHHEHKPHKHHKVRFHNDTEIEEKYTLGKKLGEGAFATVFIGTRKKDKKDYAIKQVDRTKMHWGDRDALQDEIQSLVSVKGGPNIVQLYEVFSPNTKDCYLVMELLTGGELFDRILEKRTFTEREARNVTRGLLSALDYMHTKRIAHRDLKPGKNGGIGVVGL